jgi:hypothetical protein
VDLIDSRIYLIHGQKVMVYSDLAELYQVETKALNRAVTRNPERFPQGFMFQLTKEEAESLRCQSVTSNTGRGGRRYLPFVFTEHGVAILSSVLSSQRAVQMNILIIRVREAQGDVGYPQGLGRTNGRLETSRKVTPQSSISWRMKSTV